MKKNNLKILLTCLSLLISLVFFGCAQQRMTEGMGNGMGTATEETMDTMRDDGMSNDMDTMKDPKMEEPGQDMPELENGKSMDEMKDKTMTPAKEGMMN